MPDSLVHQSRANYCHNDFFSSGSNEDNFLYLKYYADEEERQRWSQDWPDDVVPPHESLPYDRDSQLPKSTAG